MKITDYIAALQAIHDEHGDLDVENLTVRLDRVTSSAPEIDFRKILKGRESKPCFFYSCDDADRKGEKVCRIY